MHWNNSNFQLTYFIAGMCHTPDEAYRVLLCQLEDREVALASALKNRADRTDAVLDILARQEDACVEACRAEIDHIRALIAKVQPLRQFAHLSDREAAQACQREEWRLKLRAKAENFLLSQGSVPADELAAMRAHPDFANIAAHINEVSTAIRSGGYNLEEAASWCAGLLSEAKE
jgi:hypothetical protein